MVEWFVFAFDILCQGIVVWQDQVTTQEVAFFPNFGATFVGELWQEEDARLVGSDVELSLLGQGTPGCLGQVGAGQLERSDGKERSLNLS